MPDAFSNVILKAEGQSLTGFDFESNSEWKEPFFFVQAADTQFGMFENYQDGTVPEQYPNVRWDKEMEICQETVRILNCMNPKPAFFVICGDMTDAFPERWASIKRNQTEDFKRVFSKLDKEIPIICVCGNHDIDNSPTPETVSSYRNDFGSDYFSFWRSGVHFIVINSQYYKDSTFTSALAAEQESWLLEELAMSKVKGSKHIVVFQHIPWYVNDPEEPDHRIFNIESNIRQRMLKKLYEAGVCKVFCGHYHRNGGAWYNDMELIVTSALGLPLGNDPVGMRLVKVRSTEIKHEYLPLSHFPTNINILNDTEVPTNIRGESL